MAKKVPFPKPATSINDQVSILRGRGLVIDDEAKAEHYLRYIGYYRLAGYARHFRAGDFADPEKYHPDVSFNDVLELYIFDRKVRLLVFDALERVEVAVRATLNSVGSLQGGGPFWLTNANNFDYRSHQNIIQEISSAIGDIHNDNHQHQFIAHFYGKYSDPYPPSWMLMECFSLGAISRSFKNLRGSLRQEAAKEFSLQHDILESWLHSLTHARNICAHHSRCWKRTFTIQPKIPKKYQSFIPTGSGNKLYMQFWMLNHFMNAIADGSRCPGRLASLIADKPKTKLSDMGFPEGWADEGFWSLNAQPK